MNTSRYKLLAAWLLLFCFIAGQAMVYAHKHHILKYADAHHPDSEARDFTEKCKLCDVMHHSDIAITQNEGLAANLPVVLFAHPQVAFNFTSLGLILSDGLSPPCFINS
ncbi:hypothetical protein [Mucilaginibacter hurinus]|nr:hypothetical protein [Mucilaginibacter hurinus]